MVQHHSDAIDTKNVHQGQHPQCECYREAAEWKETRCVCARGREGWDTRTLCLEVKKLLLSCNVQIDVYFNAENILYYLYLYLLFLNVYFLIYIYIFLFFFLSIIIIIIIIWCCLFLLLLLPFIKSDSFDVQRTATEGNTSFHAKKSDSNVLDIWDISLSVGRYFF